MSAILPIIPEEVRTVADARDLASGAVPIVIAVQVSTCSA